MIKYALPFAFSDTLFNVSPTLPMAFVCARALDVWDDLNSAPTNGMNLYENRLPTSSIYSGDKHKY